MKDLKIFPPAAAKILRLANNPSANLRSIEKAIKLDPVLTARVLKIANSAFYGAPNRIDTLGQALGVMGFLPAREMSVALAIGSLQTQQSSTGKALWKHSLKTASATRILSRYIEGVDGNALFIAGLLHDIGQSVLITTFPDVYGPLFDKFHENYTLLLKLSLIHI